jgi:hypothetical protein
VWREPLIRNTGSILVLFFRRNARAAAAAAGTQDCSAPHAISTFAPHVLLISVVVAACLTLMQMNRLNAQLQVWLWGLGFGVWGLMLSCDVW